MQVIKVYSAALLGAQAIAVEVEVHATRGLPSFDIVGLPESPVKEGRKRIRSAILSAGFDFPTKRLTVNLAPANLRKSGATFDLPIAIGLLAASRQLDPRLLVDGLFVGELALDGAIRPCCGGVAMAELCAKVGFSKLHLPFSSDSFCHLVRGCTVCVAQTLGELVGRLNGQAQPHLNPMEAESRSSVDTPEFEGPSLSPFSHIHGQKVAKRALSVAAAGFHSAAMVGPPGSGKSLLAKATVDLLPGLAGGEAIEVARMESLKEASRSSEVLRRPFRSPHHTISIAGLLGTAGGSQPGEMAMAHRGLLFMDEFPEFQRHVIEAMREPLEEGGYSLVRACGRFYYDSRCMLIIALNPCPCGFYGDESQLCPCSASAIERYRRKLSGPIMDRIDIHLPIARVPYVELQVVGGADEKDYREEVRSAFEIQQRRYRSEPFHFNSELKPETVEQFVQISRSQRVELQRSLERFHLSLRAYHRILKLARTIADLESSEVIADHHLMEALHYRVSSPLMAARGDL